MTTDPRDSPTPLTNRVERDLSLNLNTIGAVPADFARSLERALATERDHADRLVEALNKSLWDEDGAAEFIGEIPNQKGRQTRALLAQHRALRSEGPTD
jgi:hypothetical protein